jgi:hypothetical protein
MVEASEQFRHPAHAWFLTPIARPGRPRAEISSFGYCPVESIKYLKTRHRSSLQSVVSSRVPGSDLGPSAMLRVPILCTICVQMGLVVAAEPANEPMRSIDI